MVYNKQFHFSNLIHPWLTLDDVLKSKEMTQKEFALRVGVSPKHITEIINWKSNISPDVASKFEKVLGISASFWNNLQKSYDEDKVLQQEAVLLKKEREVVKNYTCYNLLKKYNLVKDTKKREEKLKSLHRFFSISSLKLLPNLPVMAFRKNDKNDVSEENFRSWIRVWEIVADKIDISSYSSKKLENILPQLKLLTQKDQVDIKQLESIFAEIGILFVFVEKFEKVPVVWIARKYKGSPMIQISDRWKKTDIFWFTLFHEIGHILHHYDKLGDMFIDYENNEKSKMEKEADDFAQNTLIDQKIYKNWSALPFDTLCNNLWVWKSIVAWRLAHDFGDANKKIWIITSKYRTRLEVENLQI